MAGGYDPAVPAGGVLFDFMGKVFHRFTVNQKVQSEGPCEKYPQGSGINVFTTNTSTEIAINKSPAAATCHPSQGVPQGRFGWGYRTDRSLGHSIFPMYRTGGFASRIRGHPNSRNRKSPPVHTLPA
jgi:hypothetical protein